MIRPGFVSVLLPALLTFVLTTCDIFFQKKDQDDTDTTGSAIEETVIRSGSVTLPEGTTVSVDDLAALSLVGSVDVGPEGNFTIAVPTGTIQQMVFFHLDSGDCALLGLDDPTTQAIEASATSTALCLTLFNPFLTGINNAERTEYLESVKRHNNFSDLVEELDRAYCSDAKTALDPSTNPIVYQLAAQIMRDSMTSLGTSTAKSVSSMEIDTAAPYIEDAEDSKIKFINPQHIYYGVGIYDRAVDLRETFLLDRIEHWISVKWDWPPSFVWESARSTEYDLGDGYYRIFVTKGRDWNKFFDLDDPVGIATFYNTMQCAVYILDIIAGKIHLPVNPGSLITRLNMSPQLALAIGTAVGNGDINSFLFHISEFLAENAEVIAYWLYQDQKQTAAKYVHDSAGLLEGISEFLSIPEFLNGPGPFIWDIFTAPDNITYFVTQSDGSIVSFEEDFPPVASIYINPSSGDTNTVFTFDASNSFDDKDLLAQLLFRWDWDGDGAWDFDWTNTSMTNHIYAEPGEYYGTVEVRDSSGLVTAARQLVSVVDEGTGAELCFGTWINANYDSMNGMPPAKVILTSDGTAELFDSHSDVIPLSAYGVTVEASWQEGGSHYYKLRSMHDYSLVKIDSSGDVMEANSDPSNYPSSINPKDNMYGIWYRKDGSVAPDIIPPYIVSSVPANGAVNVPVDNLTVTIVFSETMVLPWSVSFENTSSQTTIAWEDDDVLLITFLDPLPLNSGISIILNPSTHGLNFKDRAWNPLPADTEIQFFTAASQ
jgi:hypothetical protein